MLLKPITTEKAISGIELRNALTFQADKTVSKTELKIEVEKEYGAKVKSVNTQITQKGTKKVIIVFKDKGKAAEIAAKLKLV